MHDDNRNRRRAPLIEPLESRRLLAGLGVGETNPTTPFIEAQVGPSLYEENPGSTSYVTFTRRNNDQPAVSVTYTVGGSATRGDDYEAEELTGTVFFDEGDTGVTIPITVKDDADIDASTNRTYRPEDIVVTLQDGDDYDIRHHPAVRIEINDGTKYHYDHEYRLVGRPDHTDGDVAGSGNGVTAYATDGWEYMEMSDLGNFGVAAEIQAEWFQSKSETFGFGAGGEMSLESLGFPLSLSMSASKSWTDESGKSQGKTLSKGGPGEPDKKYWITAYMRTQDMLYVSQQAEPDGTTTTSKKYVRLGYVYNVSLGEVWVLERKWSDPDLGFKSTQPRAPTQPKSYHFTMRPTGVSPDGPNKLFKIPGNWTGGWDELFEDDDE